MTGKCTCGVELVDGARFCHKCGRPVDGVTPEVEESDLDASAATTSPAEAPTLTPPPTIVILPPVMPATAVGLQSGPSVRAALSAAAIMFVPALALMQISGMQIMLLLGVLLTGLLGVVLFSRRTGRTLTPIEGARQGWISGLFFFLITLVLITLAFVLISSNGEVIPQIKEQLKAQGSLTPEATKALELMQQPGLFAGGILVTMVLSFVLFTSMSSLGGMLGARLLTRRGLN